MPKKKPLVVVSGASQGIGAGIAKEFASRREAKLALVARNRTKLNQVARSCQGKGGTVKVFPADLTISEEVAAVGLNIQEQFGVPDIVVNNAGAFTPGSILETDSESFRYQVDVNLTSAFDLTKAFLGPMMERGSGHIFYMASVASIRAYAGGAAYCAAKHGLLGLARVVREETKESGIRVTTLLPGATLTPSWEGVDEPKERFMSVADLAKTIVDIYELSDRTVVEEIVLRPQLGDL